MSKIKRNELCPCGSGKKYKKCCLRLENEIMEVSKECDVMDEESLVKTISILDNIENVELSFNAKLQKAQFLQKLGRHDEVISLFDNYLYTELTEEIIVKYIKGISYYFLHKFEKSIECFEFAKLNYNLVKIDKSMVGGIYLEEGRAYSTLDNNVKALEHFEIAAKMFQGVDELNYARSIANIGIILLLDNDKSKNKRGEMLLQQSSEIKRKFGDLQGLSTIYCNLGGYYLKNKEYEKAIVQFRWDQKVSLHLPDKDNLLHAHKNLGIFYLYANQLKSAEHQINLGLKLAREINNEYMISELESILEIIKERYIYCSKNNIDINKNAACLCQCGKKYHECCGIADHEPMSLPWNISNVMNLDRFYESMSELKENGIKPTAFDFIFRGSEDVKGRLSWQSMEFKNGWMKLCELPDMANQHLACAEVLAEEAMEDSDISKPISCLLLSVCGIEAFMNQIAFFLVEHKGDLDSEGILIPEEVSEDVLAYQRHTELKEKCSQLGKVLCGEYWDDQCEIVKDFHLLVSLRNEFVHFKSSEYEQLIPPPSKENKYLKLLKDKITLNGNGTIPMSWTRRVLSPSLAKWSLKVADDLIDYMKSGYYKSRMNNNFE